MWTTNNFPGQRSGADPGKPSELRGKTIKCGYTVWKMRAGNPTPVHVESLAKVQHARTDLRSLNIRRERRHRWTAERRALLRIRGDHPFFGTLALFVVAVFECLQLLRQALLLAPIQI